MPTWAEQNRGIIAFILLATLLGFGGGYVLKQPQDELATPIVIVEPTFTPSPSPTATSTATFTPSPSPSPSPSPTPRPIRVYISGAVNQPDVYILPPGSIIKDAVIAAQGFTEQADSQAVNLALALQDQQQIHIPAIQDQVATPPILRDGVAPTLPPPTATPAPVVMAENVDEKSAPVEISAKININTASADVLTKITGVGPAIAAKIIDYRQNNGPFASIEEIIKVNGIGPVTFEKMKNQISVE